MNCTQAKQININDYLTHIGLAPVKRIGSGTWYHSPVSGGDRTPSFEVSLNGKAFHDWSSGACGNLIDLVMAIERCSTVSEALRCLTRVMGGSAPSTITFAAQAPALPPSSFRILKVSGLTDRRLLAYAYSRGIPREIAQTYCVQVTYQNRDKMYIAIGFRNNAGGYELRSNAFKGATRPKAITVIGDLADCPFLIFEGFFDFLSSVRLGWYDATSMNAIVLNSTKMLQQSMEILGNASEIWCFLDNDDEGRRALKKIQCVRPDAQDKSFLFHQQKDLNEMLVKQRP